MAIKTGPWEAHFRGFHCYLPVHENKPLNKSIYASSRNLVWRNIYTWADPFPRANFPRHSHTCQYFTVVCTNFSAAGGSISMACVCFVHVHDACLAYYAQIRSLPGVAQGDHFIDWNLQKANFKTDLYKLPWKKIILWLSHSSTESLRTNLRHVFSSISEITSMTTCLPLMPGYYSKHLCYNVSSQIPFLAENARGYANISIRAINAAYSIGGKC